MSEIAELKPCPFCGGEAAIEQTGRQELTLRCVGVQPSGLKGYGPKFVQKVKAHSLEWLSGKMAERWNRRVHPPLTDEVKLRRSTALDELGALPANEVTE